MGWKEWRGNVDVSLRKVLRLPGSITGSDGFPEIVYLFVVDKKSLNAFFFFETSVVVRPWCKNIKK